MKDNFPTLGEKLKYFRKRAGLSQLELETEINASPGMISRIEKGTINPTKETILKTADILDLHSQHIDYLIGKTVKSATEEEIRQARLAVKEYFDKKSTLAYITSERSQLIDISKGFRLLIGLDEAGYKSLLGKSFPLMLLRDEFGLKKFIDPEKMEKVLKDAFSRTYSEMGFMKGDPYLEEIVDELKKYPQILQHWQALDEKPTDIGVRTMESRTVYLKYNGVPVKMKYHAEVLPSNPRFTILDYTPTNFVVKLLQKFT